MKYKVPLFILGVLMLLGAGCATNKADVGKIEWKTENFKNTEYNFEFNLSYPSDWKIDKADDSSNVIASIEGVNEASSSFTVMVLATGQAAKDAKAVAAKTKQSFEREFPASTISEGKVSPGNRQWLSLLVKKLLISARGAGETTYTH